VNDKCLEVGGTLGKQLASVNRRTSDNRGVVDVTVTEDSIVRRLVARAKEEVSDTVDLNLQKKKKRMLVEEELIIRAVLYRSECKNLEKLASYSRV
jgi:hypothetical protein